MYKLYHDIAFRTSAMVTKAYSTSFSVAVRMLPLSQRMAIYSIYGFVRFADEIVDTFLDKKQVDLLNNFERELQEAFTYGISLNPILHSFAKTVDEFNISHKHIDAFMKSMRMDLFKHDYESEKETREYIRGSAEVVGLMCLKVFVYGDEEKYHALEGPAIQLGSAFQKVNFLRDLKADKEKLHRTYFSDLLQGELDEKVKVHLVQDIESEFAEAKIGIRNLPGRERFGVLVAYLYYIRLLRKLKQTPANKIMNKRIRVSDFSKLVLLIQAYLMYKFRLI